MIVLGNAVAASIGAGGQSATNALNLIPTYAQSGLDWGIKGAFGLLAILGAVMLIRFVVVRSTSD